MFNDWIYQAIIEPLFESDDKLYIVNLKLYKNIKQKKFFFPY